MFNPITLDSACQVTRKGSINIAINQDNRATFERWYNIALVHFCEIRCMQHAQEPWLH
jgi:hypothetical protein